MCFVRDHNKIAIVVATRAVERFESGDGANTGKSHETFFVVKTVSSTPFTKASNINFSFQLATSHVLYIRSIRGHVVASESIGGDAPDVRVNKISSRVSRGERAREMRPEVDE